MNSNEPCIEEVKLPKIIAVCHKGTQTNDDSEGSSVCSSKSEGTSPFHSDVSLKLFEFNQIVQDSDHPETITVIKDTFSEEVIDHPHDKTKDTIANRYKYCREVIKPFIKDYPTDHQSSDEEIIKEVLESVQKDFPDYQSCFNNTDNLYNMDKTTFLCDKVEAQSPSKSGSNIICPEKPPKKPEPKGSAFSLEKKKPDEYDDPYDPCSKPKCERKAVCPEEIKPCKKPKAEPRKPPPPYCKDDSGPHCTQQLVTGCETLEDAKELDKQRKKACKASPGGSNANLLPPPSSPPAQKSIIEAHCDAFDTVKQAASLLLGKVYDTTKETVILIRTESAKHLEKITASKSECEDKCDEPQPQPKPKNTDPCAKEVSNIISSKNVVENLDRLQTYDAEDLLHKMVEKMESTISMISEHIDIDVIANILKSDKKNAYDRPTTPPQKLKLEPSHHSQNEQPGLQESIHDTIQANINTANNMFTAIKSKIFSMFSDVTKGTEKQQEEDEPENPENDDDEDDEES